MKSYFFDTNILIYLEHRINSPHSKLILTPDSEDALNGVLQDKDALIFLSFISVAEILVYMDKPRKKTDQNFDDTRRKFMFDLINRFELFDEPLSSVWNQYYQIERYNYNLENELNLPIRNQPGNGGHFKMGKNDIWILSQSIYLGATLISTDKKAYSHFTTFDDLIVLEFLPSN